MPVYRPENITGLGFKGKRESQHSHRNSVISTEYATLLHGAIVGKHDEVEKVKRQVHALSSYFSFIVYISNFNICVTLLKNSQEYKDSTI